MVSIQDLNVQANLVFLYYEDLASAEEFYKNTLGLEMVLDYGFAKLFRISQTTYVGLVDEKKGMHRATEPKTVTLSFVTEQIDEWYMYLMEKGVERAIWMIPVTDAKDVMESPQFNAREFFVQVEHPELTETINYPGLPMKVSGFPYRPQRRAPLVGEHNEEVYIRELGFSREELARFKASQVI